MITGLAVWLGSASSLYGAVNVKTTGQILPCVYGTVASAFSPLPYTLILSFLPIKSWRQNFDWADFRREKLAFDVDSDIVGAPVDETLKRELEEGTATAGGPKVLKRWARIAAYWSIATFLGHWVLWPLPMYASKYIFSQTFFQAWLVVAIIWIWGSMLVAGFFPLIGGWRQFQAVWLAVRGKPVERRASVVVDDTKESSSSDIAGKETGTSTGTPTELFETERKT